jgi:hypothetical protein
MDILQSSKISNAVVLDFTKQDIFDFLNFFKTHPFKQPTQYYLYVYDAFFLVSSPCHFELLCYSGSDCPYATHSQFARFRARCD